jgi:hypothetical protein
MSTRPWQSTSLAFTIVVATGLTVVGLRGVWKGVAGPVGSPPYHSVDHQAAPYLTPHHTVQTRLPTTEAAGRSVDDGVIVPGLVNDLPNASFLNPFGGRNWPEPRQIANSGANIDTISSPNRPTDAQNVQSVPYVAQHPADAARANEAACSWNRDEPCWE